MRVAIVTGASSGMGREFVLQIGALYKNLDEIWVIARRKGNLERVAEQSRLPLRIFDGDLLKKPVYKAFCEALCEDTPDIRMLVNAAGFGRSGSVEEINMQRRRIQTDMVGLNCQALTRMTLLCLPYMHPGSRIVNLASAAAFFPEEQPQDAEDFPPAFAAAVVVFCGLCGNEILCAELFPFAQRRA